MSRMTLKGKQMKFSCSYTKLVPIEHLVPNPKNPNRHPENQIERLAKLIDYQGQRHPVIVSNRSGFIVVGHGRYEAIKKLGWSEIAVDYQDFDNEAQEYAFVVSDNAIAEWAELDKMAIADEALNLEIDDDLFGFDGFEAKSIEMDNSDYSDKNKEIDTENFGNDLEHTCPKCGFEFNE